MHISLVVQIIILNITVIINRFLSEFIWETPEEQVPYKDNSSIFLTTQ